MTVKKHIKKTVSLDAVKDYLTERITNWYINATIDYNVEGRLLSIDSPNEDSYDADKILVIRWEEIDNRDDKKYIVKTEIHYYTDYTLQQIYDIWSSGESDWEIISEETINKSKGDKMKVDKNKVRKANIKKWEDTYYVPVAYVGLVELNSRDYTSSDDRIFLQGRATSPDGQIYASIVISGKIEYASDSGWDYYYDWAEQFPEGKAPLTYEDYEANNNDISIASYDASIGYGLTQTKEHLNGANQKGFGSIEDAISWLKEESENMWGDVVIAMREVVETYEEKPPTITLQTISEPIELKRSIKEGTLEWEGGKHLNSNEMKFDTSIVISGQSMKSYEGIRHNVEGLIERFLFAVSTSETPDIYLVMIRNTIRDENLRYYQTNADRTGYYGEHSVYGYEPTNELGVSGWRRAFEGTFTSLEEAIAFAEDKVNESITEFMEYSSQAHEYEELGRGRGNRKEIDVVGGHEYYPQDNPDYALIDEYGPPYILGSLREPYKWQNMYDLNENDTVWTEFLAEAVQMEFQSVDEANKWVGEHIPENQWYRHTIHVYTTSGVPVAELQSTGGYSLFKSKKSKKSKVKKAISEGQKIEVDGKTYTLNWIDEPGSGRNDRYCVFDDNDECITEVSDTMSIDEIKEQIRHDLPFSKSKYPMAKRGRPAGSLNKKSEGKPVTHPMTAYNVCKKYQREKNLLGLTYEEIEDITKANQMNMILRYTKQHMIKKIKTGMGMLYSFR